MVPVIPKIIHEHPLFGNQRRVWRNEQGFGELNAHKKTRRYIDIVNAGGL
jgi:hypothetical protein